MRMKLLSVAFLLSLASVVSASLFFFKDGFNRPDSNTVGNGWVEFEGQGSDISIKSERLVAKTPQGSRAYNGLYQDFGVGTIDSENFRSGIQFKTTGYLASGLSIGIKFTNPNVSGDDVVLTFNGQGCLQLSVLSQYAQNCTLPPHFGNGEGWNLELQAVPGFGYEGRLYPIGQARPLAPTIVLQTSAFASTNRGTLRFSGEAGYESTFYCDDFFVVSK